MKRIKIDWKIISIILFMLLVFRITLNVMETGYDYYWHVKLGEYIIKNKTVPTMDIFSWYGIINNLPWISHEWLSGVILYLNKIIFGKYAVLIFCTTMYFTIMLLLFFLNKKEYLKNIKFTLLHILIGSILLSALVTPRPHLLSYCLLIISIYLVKDFSQNENSKKIYFLPLISLIWANIHGGSSNLSYIILGIFFISKIIDKKMTLSLLKKYLFVFVMIIISLAINPHGIKIVFYPYLNMLDTTMKTNIAEWNITKITGLNSLTLYLFILLLTIILLKERKKVKTVDILLFLSFLFLSTTSIRFMPFIYIVSTFFIFNYIPSCEIAPINYKVITFVSIISLIISIVYIPKFLEKVNKKIIDDEIITYLRDNKPERLYNYYDYGGYLIYNDIKVFYDGRADIFSKNIFQSAIDVIDLKADSLTFIEKFDFDYYLLPKNTMLVNYLLESNYELIYDINNVVLIKKA